MIVWVVFECIYDWPEAGGGSFMKKIFQNKDDAEKYCEKMNREAKEDEEDISYYVEQWKVL